MAAATIVANGLPRANRAAGRLGATGRPLHRKCMIVHDERAQCANLGGTAGLQIPVPFVWDRNLFIFHGGRYDDLDKAMAMAAQMNRTVRTQMQ